MKTYYVLWTCGNDFSRLVEVCALSAAATGDLVTRMLLVRDFKSRGSVYVFDSPPAYRKGVDWEQKGDWR